jgi:hypothetical protein
VRVRATRARIKHRCTIEMALDSVDMQVRAWWTLDTAHSRVEEMAGNCADTANPPSFKQNVSATPLRSSLCSVHVTLYVWRIKCCVCSCWCSSVRENTRIWVLNAQTQIPLARISQSAGNFEASHSIPSPASRQRHTEY